MRRSFVSVICGFAALSAFGDDSVITPVTTKDYVDNALAEKQPLSPITGVNKIMTYGATTGAQTGSRNIETTSIGTDTTADKVAAAGIIVAALNDKQKKVIGSNNWVMTGTNTAGNLGGKPIYSTTNNYVNALVTAETVNNAAIAAANSEFSCETYVEGAEQIPDNCLIWRIHTDGPTLLPTPRTSIGDPTIPGSSFCYRSLSGYYNYNSEQCSADGLSYVGPIGNKSGKWVAMFPYGELRGVSLCSTIPGVNPNTFATDENNLLLDAEYATQAGTGTGNGYSCWCKIEGPLTSKWTFIASYDFASSNPAGYCRGDCTVTCTRHLITDAAFRTEIFRTVQ